MPAESRARRAARRRSERQDAGAAGTLDAQDSRKSAGAPAPRNEAAQSATDATSSIPVPAPMAKLGTGHGRSEQSPVQMVRFERESATPNETIAIHYDRRENLVAMGILPPPVDRALAESVSPRGRGSSPDPPPR